ncbi:MAG: sensor histidine kinase [Acidobacteriaceae bacterium]
MARSPLHPITRYLPRTIRGQLIVGTILLQLLLLTIFLTLLLQRQSVELRLRDQQRLAGQVLLLSEVSQHSIEANESNALENLVKAVRVSAAIRFAKITDLQGFTLAHSDTILNGTYLRDKSEIAAMGPPYRLKLIQRDDGGYEAVAPVMVDGQPVALAWVTPDTMLLGQQIRPFIQTALMYALLALLTNTLLAILLARTVTQPLRRLLHGMQQLVRDPERHGAFPLPVTAINEAGELTAGFNTMVRELEEQRAGLNDTLALLDSMLANAPIGFAFFDQEYRYVRLNQFLADMHELPISRHLDRPLSEVFPASTAHHIMEIVKHVFDTSEAVRDVDLSGELPHAPGLQHYWLMSFYPVRTGQEPVRWVGAVVVETTQRRQAEEALRRTEKLAAAGRLAASIAHEINNPLEAVTNLLYLLRHHPSLDGEAQEFAELAQRELLRVSQITQQTLRFYRQSTQPIQSNIGELLDSVLLLHQGRIHSAQVDVVRKYVGSPELYSFSGELRQLFANLVGNALDAMNQGGRLTLTVRESRSWKDGTPGVRIFVADTGCGMSEQVRRRIFEAFFTTKDATGTGLGLWVSAEIVEKHKGTIRVRSRTDAPTGTVFMVFFPHDALRPASLPELESANHTA